MSVRFITSKASAINILFHTEKGDFLTAGPMKKVEALLKDKGFSKCHNAYLIHLMHVTGIVQNNVLLSDSTTLPVSRAKKKVSGGFD
ncbi:MAG: LytTR family transcriptional regulator DNA-binding domain-containing protein [Mediterraneibacter gnavus]